MLGGPAVDAWVSPPVLPMRRLVVPLRVVAIGSELLLCVNDVTAGKPVVVKLPDAEDVNSNVTAEASDDTVLLEGSSEDTLDGVVGSEFAGSDEGIS